MQTIYYADIIRATGLSRMTLWRSFHGQEPPYQRDGQGKRFMVADVIACLRQCGRHNPKHETALLSIDRQRRAKTNKAEK